jgi:hypothetical protein
MGQADSFKYGPSDKHCRIFRFGFALNFTMRTKAAFVPFTSKVRKWPDFDSERDELQHNPAETAVATPANRGLFPKCLQHCLRGVVEITDDSDMTWICPGRRGGRPRLICGLRFPLPRLPENQVGGEQGQGRSAKPMRDDEVTHFTNAHRHSEKSVVSRGESAALPSPIDMIKEIIVVSDWRDIPSSHD